jgi:hypothetical protein
VSAWHVTGFTTHSNVPEGSQVQSGGAISAELAPALPSGGRGAIGAGVAPPAVPALPEQPQLCASLQSKPSPQSLAVVHGST